MTWMKFSRAMRVLALCLLPAGCAKAPPAAPVFDVPSLVGKRLEEVQKTLGVPSQSALWTREDVGLQIEASPRGRITRFTFRAAKPMGEGEKADFLRRLKLQESDARYSIEWLENESDVGKSDGVQVVPAQKTYAVTLRVTGSNIVTWVKYAPAAADAPGGGESLTMPPWDAQVAAQSGAVVSLEAGFAQITDSGKLTLQIEANGKVEAQKTISAGRTKIETELP